MPKEHNKSIGNKDDIRNLMYKYIQGMKLQLGGKNNQKGENWCNNKYSSGQSRINMLYFVHS